MGDVGFLKACRSRERHGLVHAMLAGAAIVGAAPTGAAPTVPVYGSWGFDLAAVDRTIRPADDFFAYANGTWLRNTAIPADKASISLALAMSGIAEERVHTLLEAARAHAGAAPASVEAKVGTFYASFMDTGRVEQLGSQPLQPLLQQINKANDLTELGRLMGFSPQDLEGSLFALNIYADRKDPTRYQVNVGQAALGMPDRDYYLSPAMATKKAAYQVYVERLLRLTGSKQPAEDAIKVVAFETRIAEASWSRVERRDFATTYNPMTVAELATAAPGFPWRDFLDAAGLKGTDDVVVAERTALPKIAGIFAEAPLPTLKAWMAFRLADNAAPYLSAAFVDAAFRFRSTALQGQPSQTERWQRGVLAVGGGHYGSGDRFDRFGNMGWAVGELYAKAYFPPSMKRQMVALVTNVQNAFRDRLTKLDWMGAETRSEALLKLGTYTIKVGYPDKPRDYSALAIRRDDLLGNVRRAAAADWAFQVKRLAGPVDASEWLLTPQTVDAYNGPFKDIVFPAAVLQAPLFDAAADPAINYGAAGASIAHELTHGFDDQGRKLDATGALRDWWQKADEAEFRRRAERLVAQFSAFEPLPGVHVNGALTLGENIADLGGLSVALDAYHDSLNGKPAPVVDGFTGDQRVFLGWAQVWRGKLRDDALRQKIASDPHSPREYRVNGILRNLDAFDRAYEVKPGEGMYLAPSDRVRIW